MGQIVIGHRDLERVGNAAILGRDDQTIAGPVIDDTGRHTRIRGIDGITHAGQRRLAGVDCDGLGSLVRVERERAAAVGAKLYGQGAGADGGAGSRNSGRFEFVRLRQSLNLDRVC